MGVSQSVGENCSDIESSYAGEEERTIACNAKFLMDALSRMEKDDIELSVNEELKPIQLRGKDEENFIYIVMPFKK
jgi:DNA polymerase III sliding clamp (beta) subunit (PCNA family)